MIHVRKLIVACNFNRLMCFMMWCIMIKYPSRTDRASCLNGKKATMHGIGRFEHQWQMDFNVQHVYQLNRFILSSVYSRSCGKVSQQVLNSGSIPRTEETTKISRHETRFAIGRYIHISFYACYQLLQINAVAVLAFWA